ncbi:hypothetical protein PV327_000369 [Microctonus hyperodae]|uniref:Uncharacterized protein n=1 Tax=Microctonus hyperodae TaxID=165561 RepID=A0AA39G6F0_MICHY|nr:hypothetical protein PV327_000369 [Microctonus hyperodae]
MAESTSSVSKNEKSPMNTSFKKIELLKTHKELIEKKSKEIHLSWKLAPPILYFMCAITGYSTSILFHIFWNDIYTNHCPLWARIIPPAITRTIHMKNSLGEEIETQVGVINDDWRRHLRVIFKYEYHCNFFHAICQCSCLFGVIWCMLFARCASGIYAAQWLIILPALMFQIVFTIIVINTVRNFESGYASFVNNLNAIAPKFMNRTELVKFTKKCQLVSYYIQAYNTVHANQICSVHEALQTLSWIMTLSWIGGLFILILRLIVLNDFHLRRIIVYKVSVGKNIEIPEVDIINGAKPKPSRIRQFFNSIFRNQTD